MLAAFGLGSAVWRVGGAQCTTWRAGYVFLKPVDPVAEAEWLGSLLSDLAEAGFRDDVWSMGDRAAWDDELPDVVHAELAST